MFCTKCGAKLEEHQKFCTKCGTKRIEIDPEAVKKTPKKKKSKLPLFIVLGVLAVALIGVLLWFVFNRVVEFPLAGNKGVSYENCAEEIPIGIDSKIWGMSKVDFEEYTGLTLDNKNERLHGLAYEFTGDTVCGDCKGGVYIDEEYGLSYLHVSYFADDDEIKNEKEQIENWLSESFEETETSDSKVHVFTSEHERVEVTRAESTMTDDRESYTLMCFSNLLLDAFAEDGMSMEETVEDVSTKRLLAASLSEPLQEGTEPAEAVEQTVADAGTQEVTSEAEVPVEKKEWPVWNLNIDNEVKYTQKMYKDIMGNLDHYEYHDFGDYYCYVTNGVPVVIVVKEGFNHIGYEREYIGMDIFYVTLSKNLVNSYEFFFADHQLYRCVDYKNNSTHIYADEEWETYELMSRELITERASLVEDIKMRLKK